MAGIHRSSTLRPAVGLQLGEARDGRDSPLKYTAEAMKEVLHEARDGRDSPLKYTISPLWASSFSARDGRDSPLKYTGP